MDPKKTQKVGKILAKYYITNSEVLDLLNVWSKSFGKKKEELQYLIISKLSYLVYTKIKIYRKKHYYNDLFQEGRLALIRAMNDFNIDKGSNFFTIASWYISNNIRDYLKGVNREVVCENVEQFVPAQISPQDYYENIEKDKLIKKAILSLPKMERYVLVMRYGFFDSREYTLREIGEMFSVSKQYVEQVEKKAVLNLQKKIDKELGENL